MKTSLERDENTTPTKQIIQKCRTLAEDKIPVVILATGGFNPAHFMHLVMFERAKKSIEEAHENLEVVAGYISPSHDEYVTKKLTPYSTIPHHHRVDIVNIWIKELGHEDWLFVDQGEVKHHKFIDHSTVTYTLRQYLIGKDPSLEKVKVMYLAGRDLWLRTRGMGNLQNKEFGVVVMMRKETSETATSYHRNLEKELLENVGEDLIIVPAPNSDENDDNYSLSSTKIRKNIREKKYEDINPAWMCQPTIDYIREQKLLSEPYFCNERMRQLFAPYIEAKEKREKEKLNEDEGGCSIL